MVAGAMAPSQLLRKFASYPRQHELAVALREIGRIERTLFIIDWLLDADMQRRAQIGLNKGEAHHALKNALRIGRQGEIRDRTAQGQHFRMAGLNLLAAIIIYWNTNISVTLSIVATVMVWTAQQTFWRISHPSGGRTSFSPANTGGPKDDQTALA